ncbi:hypothetical protein CH92_07350 [Stutzerimonas stutzeri]|uniref:Uncharacterized protein n=1 Tax=Stutzerimonas stutzeri TaxID=316 RepID=W8RS98_STUST|nr:YdbH domain-containing protein [Stutzerimonas stutzeri]AHL74931.1 hypothetical protein CH92_07350 [Stutzerimonas stutzeri]MCQ4330947.1 YdbH domain-containing protein [Stutzerimonas stutzeri]
MAKRRKVLILAVTGLVLLVLGIGVYGGIRWNQLKRELGIVTFDVSGLRLTDNHLEVRQLVVVRHTPSDERLSLTADTLRLGIESGWPLRLRSLDIDRLEVQWQPPAAADDSAQRLALPDRQELERWADWVPHNGHIVSLALALPCASGVCQEQGEMSWQHAGEKPLPATLSLQLAHHAHRLTATLDAYDRNNETHLNLRLLLDGKQRLSMQNQLTPGADSTLWRGALALSELPEAPWLLEWLGDWLDYEPPALPELPEQMRIGAGWALHLNTGDLAGAWETLDGEFRLSANLPAPWPVVGIGQLQGQLDLATQVDGGTWIPTELVTDLQLRPAAALVSKLPAQLRPDAANLKITPTVAGQSASRLPLQVHFAASGPTPLTLDSQIVLETSAPYALSLEQTRLRLQSPELLFPDARLKGLAADLRLHGRASLKDAAIQLDNDSQITLDHLSSGTDLLANALRLNFSGMDIEANFADRQLQKLQVNGQAAMTIAELRQPTLQPRGWRWSGKLDADRERLSLDGPLHNDAGLTLPVKLDHNWSRGATRLHASLPETFLRAGNPLAATLADWPQLLELNTGRLQGQGQLDLPANGPSEVTATLTAKGLGGIYDRTELSGLDANLSATLRKNQLQLEIPELTLRQANPGFTFGPLQFNGQYTGDINRIDQGRLSWRTAEVHLLGGRLWVDAGKVDLSANTQQLKAHLRGLQLPLLLDAYPAEGLSGTGVIDGELELQRSEAGISIEQGSLQAREPGGALQFRSPKIQALGQANPAMRLVTEALDDFHYDLLASNVHYAADGTLDLGLKLHGRNPALEGGRPINFSINLEEDIPALLTSLQLSDRVSETIQRRVQERLR